jgi:hypothetical protein
LRKNNHAALQQVLQCLRADLERLGSSEVA